MLSVHFSSKADKEIIKLMKEDAKNGSKLWKLIVNINKTPFEGIGKPEPLKGNLTGYWSRHITDKHRLVYRVSNTGIEILSCYGHYNDH